MTRRSIFASIAGLFAAWKAVASSPPAGLTVEKLRAAKRLMPAGPQCSCPCENNITIGPNRYVFHGDSCPLPRAGNRLRAGVTYVVKDGCLTLNGKKIALR